MDQNGEFDIIYQKEINIGFFGMEKELFEKIITEIKHSSFSKEFSLINDNISDMGKYKKASFQKIDNYQNQISDDIFDINDKIEDNLIINLNNCEDNLNNKKDKEYEEFIKEKLDFYFIFEKEIKDKNFVNKLYNYSKGNNIILIYGQNKSFEPEGYEEFILIENKVETLLNFRFDKFLLKIKNQFDMFLIFQKYSIEKNIVSFKDYLCTLEKYSNINDEKDLIELFNKFEKLSFNNDYADNTLIMLQVMTTNEKMFNNGICFNVKSLKCGFCTETLNISEFDPNVQSFLCYRCRFAQQQQAKLYNKK